MFVFARAHEPSEQLVFLFLGPMLRAVNRIGVKFPSIINFSPSLSQLIVRHPIGAVRMLALQCTRCLTIIRQGNGKLVYGGTRRTSDWLSRPCTTAIGVEDSRWRICQPECTIVKSRSCAERRGKVRSQSSVEALQRPFDEETWQEETRAILTETLLTLGSRCRWPKAIVPGSLGVVENRMSACT